jgi:hypothetical protein
MKWGGGSDLFLVKNGGSIGRRVDRGVRFRVYAVRDTIISSG